MSSRTGDILASMCAENLRRKVLTIPPWLCGNSGVTLSGRGVIARRTDILIEKVVYQAQAATDGATISALLRIGLQGAGVILDSDGVLSHSVGVKALGSMTTILAKDFAGAQYVEDSEHSAYAKVPAGSGFYVSGIKQGTAGEDAGQLQIEVHYFERDEIHADPAGT